MAYQAKRDGYVNEDEISEYIYFPNGCAALNGATEFDGTVEEFEEHTLNQGKIYYGKIHDGNKVVYNRQRTHDWNPSGSDEAVEHAKSMAMAMAMEDLFG
jgi:hypothetical protein